MSKQEMELRHLSAELRSETKDEKRVIVGYGAKFDTWSQTLRGWFKEKIARSAFDGCDMSDVVMLFNHNVDNLLARSVSGTLSLSVDEVGLRFEFSVPNTTLGNDVWEQVERGDIRGCSFAFFVEDDFWEYGETEEGVSIAYRTITKISRLTDISLVVHPAYKDTDVAQRQLEERHAEFLSHKNPSPQKVDTSYRDRTIQFYKLNQ